MGYLYYTDKENCTVVTNVLVLKNDELLKNEVLM